MARTTVEQAVAADPLTMALLLSGVDTSSLWPVGGPSTEDADEDRGADLESLTAVAAENLRLELFPPRRAATAFVSGLVLHGGDRGAARGELRLAYATRGTLMILAIDDPAKVLADPARQFLSRFAEFSERRARAA